MADLPLYRRNKLPPAESGAKPPLSLADRSGQINAGTQIAGFSGKVFEDLVQARIGNEIHAFLGNVNTAQAEFEDYVRNNPGASFEDMGAEREKMLANIESAGQKLTLPDSKNYAENWFAENRNLVKEKSQAAMQNIVAKNEMDKFEILRKGYISTGDKESLVDLYGRHAGKLINSDSARIALEADLAKIDVDLSYNSAFAELQQIAKPATGNEKPDWGKALEQINSVSFQQKYKLNADSIRELTNVIENQKTASEKALKAQQDKDLSGIFDKMNAKQIPDYNTVFNSSLPVSGDDSKQKVWEKWNKVYRGEEADTDPQTAASIKERINNLYRGQETADKIKDDIKKEFNSGKITNKGNQNNSYTGLLNDVDSKWNTIQSGVIKSAYDKAKNTNLYIPVPQQSSDEQNIKNQQIIDGYICDLDSALKDYIRNNPNASIKEIETQSDILRRRYSDMAFNEINALAPPNKSFYEFMRGTPLFRAYDKILEKGYGYIKNSLTEKPQESERVFVIKDGKKYTIPKEQLNDALVQGYQLAE